MNLIIDIGNTRAKLALFKDEELFHIEIVTHDDFLLSVLKLIKKHDVKRGIISSVIFLEKDEIAEISEKIQLIELNSELKLPFINNYGTPKTLGVDRMALVAAAVNEFPNKNVLVIDAGTCITYDFVSADKEYRGGAISPGLEMRYKALHEFTSKLPLLSRKDEIQVIGNSTEESMHSGVVHGILGEIHNFVDLYKKKNDLLTIVLTGGDTNYLANKLKIDIFAQPNFLLKGLNTILIYNNH